MAAPLACDKHLQQMFAKLQQSVTYKAFIEPADIDWQAGTYTETDSQAAIGAIVGTYSAKQAAAGGEKYRVGETYLVVRNSATAVDSLGGLTAPKVGDRVAITGVEYKVSLCERFGRDKLWRLSLWRV